MNIKELNKNNFEKTVSKQGIVFIDFWAAWCGPCKNFAPIFERIAAKYSKHTFAKVNTQEEMELTKELGIENIPSVMLFRDGIMLLKQPGYFEEEKLEDIIRQAEAVNMDKVREQIKKEHEVSQ